MHCLGGFFVLMHGEFYYWVIITLKFIIRLYNIYLIKYMVMHFKDKVYKLLSVIPAPHPNFHLPWLSSPLYIQLLFYPYYALRD